MPTTVLVPSSITIPSGQNYVDSTLTVSSGNTTSLSIGGVFTISMIGTTGSGPQYVDFRVSVKSGTLQGPAAAMCKSMLRLVAKRCLATASISHTNEQLPSNTEEQIGLDLCV